MNTAVAALAAALTMAAAPAAADPARSPATRAPVAALGFHGTAAPLGARWWLGGGWVGLDAAVGYASSRSLLYDGETLATWTFDGGLPVPLGKWDRVWLLLRPGLLYQVEQVERSGPPEAFATENVVSYDLTLEFEAEVFLADRFSVSAAHGVAYQTVDRPGSGSISTFGTTGGNFTSVGFHVYFLAAGR